MVYRVALITAVLVVFGTRAFGGEKSSPPTEREIKLLVDALVSPNPKPITGDEDQTQAPDYRLPEGFDREKQKRVEAARYKLKQLGPAAFPFLIDRFDDEHYCVTVSDGLSGYCRNWTVGKTCRAIIFDQLQPYGPWQAIRDEHRGPARPSYPGVFLTSREAATTWWKGHKRKTLDQLQLEALDWVIAEEAKIQKTYSIEEGERLNELRKEITHTGRALTRGNYYLIDVEQ